MAMTKTNIRTRYSPGCMPVRLSYNSRKRHGFKPGILLVYRRR